MASDREHVPETSATGRVVETWSLIRRHLFLIIFMSGVGAGLGYFHFVSTPAIYQSSCSLLVRNSSKDQAIPFQTSENASQAQRDQPPHAILVVSPAVIEKALDKPLGQGVNGEKNQRRLRDLPCFVGTDYPAQYIIGRLVARAPLLSGMERSDVINISFRDPDPLTAKAVVDAVVESYQDFLGESHKNVSLEVLELIEKARTSLLTHIKEIDSEYNQFRQETPLLFNGESKATNVHKDRMADIELARTKLHILVTERRAELQSIQDALARGASRDAVTLMIQSMKPDSRAGESGVKTVAGEIFPLLLKEQLLLQDLGADHPKVKQLQKEIELTQDFHMSEIPEEDRTKRRKRGDFLTICLDAIVHEIGSIESKITELDQLFESERQGSRSILAYEVKNEYFRKELDRTEKLYDSVVKRLDELNLMQDYGGYKTNVISPAQRGTHVAPNFNQSLLLGAVLGAGLGFVLGYLAESSDKTYRTPDEVSNHLRLPIIGHIPVIGGGISLTTRNSNLDKSLIAFHRPKSRLAESYRAIRTSLYFSTRGEKLKVIQITSPNPGDGKSTLSANLCISMAQSGKKVLLIDADFRRPRIHELFNLDKTIGISSVISGELELPDAIQSSEVENLWCMPCGERPNNPCELLTSRRFEELINILREQYDFVIIDTPPLLAVTDPSAVAARVDAVILTIRLSKRTRSEAGRSTEVLAAVGANTLGVIVNGINKSSYGYRGYAGYGGYGGYTEYGYQYRDRSGTDENHPYYTDDVQEVARAASQSSSRRSRNLQKDL